MRNRCRLAIRRAGFTLVELLVVIGIISLLISILLPSLQKARQHARSVVCMSNLRQVGMSLLQYSNANKGYTPDVWNGFLAETWHGRLMTLKYITTPKGGGPNVLLCPSQTPSAWNSEYSATTWSSEHSYAYGIRSHSVGANGWLIGAGHVKDSRRQLDFGAAATFIFVADSTLLFPGDSGHKKQRYYFVPHFASSFEANPVHLRHNRKGNFLWGDGHVSQLGFGDLLGNFGANNSGSNAFIAAAIDETPGNL